MVLGGFGWFLVVLGGFGGFRWFWVVLGGFWGFIPKMPVIEYNTMHSKLVLPITIFGLEGISSKHQREKGKGREKREHREKEGRKR